MNFGKVQNVTLPVSCSDVGKLASTSPEVAVIGLSECIELMLRSCNSLLERLHHSYFYYLITNAHEFVTVEIFLIPVLMMLLSLSLSVSVHLSKYSHPACLHLSSALLACLLKI